MSIAMKFPRFLVPQQGDPTIADQGTATGCQQHHRLCTIVDDARLVYRVFRLLSNKAALAQALVARWLPSSYHQLVWLVCSADNVCCFDFTCLFFVKDLFLRGALYQLDARVKQPWSSFRSACLRPGR